MRSLISTLLILIVSSFTITKRQYTRGYHIEWKTKNHQCNSERVESEEIVFSPEPTGVTESNVSKGDPWGGGIFVYFMFLIGAACLVAVPILLLFALVSFLAGR
jgi:hypothetical protein